MASSPTRLHVPVDVVGLQRCASRKACYPTKGHAHDAAEWMMDRDMVHAGCHITPYHCGDCGWWHVHNRRIVFP